MTSNARQKPDTGGLLFLWSAIKVTNDLCQPSTTFNSLITIIIIGILVVDNILFTVALLVARTVSLLWTIQ